MIEEKICPLHQAHAGSCKISSIECFRFDKELKQRLFPGYGYQDGCGVLTLGSDHGDIGISGFALPCTAMHGDFVRWAYVFQRIKGLSLEDALQYALLKQEVWGIDRAQILESALTCMTSEPETAFPVKSEWNCLRDRSYLFDHAQAYISF
ncbi:hypothetical protein [Paenibacillus aestuarii]|uniref:Uncharacterized protein n=1 Tax=Paenibacillus aestuarii TaxID=516965 RepID=A0ABW0KC34_9BACL|nr:hypothetical protein [Paenibacillus aestuarii]